MTTEYVVRFFDREPFEPFTVTLVDGRELHVLHPESAQIGEHVLVILLIHPTDQVEVFDNAIEQNQTTGLSIVSYLIAGKPISDEKYDPFPEAVYVHDNRFKSNGGKPAGKLGEELAKLLGAPLPDILYDGVTDPKASAGAAPVLRVRNNPGARFANFDAPAMSQPGKAPNVVRDLKPYEGELPALAPVKIAGVE